ncbi:MAG: BON domain-containing protein [Rivularia sp. T60_A2020_040]|nr:BON domain-containing protein [Rivularia sp. T60_A2020_040]
MKKFITFLIGGILLTSAVGCGEEAAKTDSENPSATNGVVQPAAREASETQGLNQPLNQPGEAADGETTSVPPTGAANLESPLESDLSKEVSKKLKENLPTSELEVKEAEGVVSVGGTVSSQEELQQIEPLTKGVKGVKGVNVEANVTGANPAEGTTNPE